MQPTTSKRVYFFIGYLSISLIILHVRVTDYRTLSTYLGDGKCKWTPPIYDLDADDYHKTLVTGYPGGSKRIVYSYIEAMTGLAFNDEWPLASNSPNRPFIKGNYPHHEGTWGYGNGLNQVIMLMRNPMHAIVEYHDVLHDIDYSGDPITSSSKSNNLYLERPSIESWREWRELRLPAEIQWYGWFIDYWMEGGLMRDIPSHDLASKDYWLKMQPAAYYESGQAFSNFVGNANVTKEYDPHCVNDIPNGTCAPKVVVSEEKLVKKVSGPTEMLKIASVLEYNKGIDLIDTRAIPCLWDEMMVYKKGLRTMMDRSGTDTDYKFKLPHLTEMVSELTRLKTKYSGPEWSTKQTAQDLVEILGDYILDINARIAFGKYE